MRGRSSGLGVEVMSEKRVATGTLLRAGPGLRCARATCILSIVSASASAQFLDLDRPSPPVLESPSASDLLIAELDREIDGLSRATVIGARAEGGIALRRFASDLLRMDGAARLWGMTIASQRDVLDDLLRRSDVPESVAIFLRLDLDVPRFDLPSEPADLDRLIRDAFAELAAFADEPSLWGWGPRTESPVEDLAALLGAWEGEGIISGQARAEFEALARQGESWPAYGRALDALVRRILAARTILDARGDLPAEAQSAAAALFARSLENVLRPELRAEALADVDALASLGELLRHARTLRGGESRDALIAAVARSLVSRSEGGSPPPLGLAQSILAQVARGGSLPGEDAIVRPLRPAWRAVVAQIAGARDRQIDLLPRVLQAPSPASDPAIVAPLGAFQRLLDDAEMIRDASDALRDPASSSREAVVREDRRQLAARLLRLGQQLSDEREREPAMEELRRFAREARLAQRAGEFPWGDDLSTRLLARSRESASAWIEAWSMPDVEGARERLGASVETLDLLARLAGHMRDLRTLDDARTSRSIDAWPGFELAPSTLTIVVAQAPERLAQTAEILLEGNLPRARDRLEGYAREYRVLTFLASLHRWLGERDASVYELVAGAPDDDAVARHRERIAELALLLEEIPAARYRNDPSDERDIRRYANHLAEILLADLRLEEKGR